MKFYTLNLPDFWGSPLVNGDYSGLTQQEESELNRFIEHWKNDLDFSCVDVPSDENGYIESSFMKYHDAEVAGVLACDCWKYQILIKPQSSLNS